MGQSNRTNSVIRILYLERMIFHDVNVLSDCNKVEEAASKRPVYTSHFQERECSNILKRKTLFCPIIDMIIANILIWDKSLLTDKMFTASHKL